MGRGHQDSIEVTSCQLGSDGGQSDTLIFEQGQTRYGTGQTGPTGDLSVVGEVSTGGSGGRFFLRNMNTADVDEFDFAAASGSTEGSSRLYVGNLSFDQTSDATFSPDGKQLVITIKDGPLASGEYGGTHILSQDVFLPAVKLERCFVKSWSTSGDADGQPNEFVFGTELPTVQGNDYVI
jgi:hypothetical protein